MTESVDRQEVRITKLGHPVDIVYKAMPLDTHAERVWAEPPLDMCTDGGSGEYRRLRVDVGQTGFFAGREFYTFYEFTVPNGGAPEVITITTPVNAIAQEIEFDVYSGSVRAELRIGGTFTPGVNIPLVIHPTNGMTTASGYTPQIAMAFGGFHTGGTVLDMREIYSDKAMIGRVLQADSPRGFPPGTYRYVFSEIGNANARICFRARWEERP